MPASFLLYTDAASVVRVAQLLAGAERRELLLRAIRETHPTMREAIDPRPTLSIVAGTAPTAIVTQPAELEIVSPS